MPEVTSSKYLVTAGWDDVPHLDKVTMNELLDSCPPFLRDARSKGTPNIGAGAIYPVAWDEVVCEPFQIPAHYWQAYGLDVGWKKTAAIWGAWDKDSDIVYCWSEHYKGEAEPAIHATAVRARAKWIPGIIDTAAHGRSQEDGKRMHDLYTGQGLILNDAIKAVETGLYEVWQRLSTNRLKFFRTMANTQFEYRLYRRDEKGHIVKENDHIMDALRYLIMGLTNTRQQPFNSTYRQEISRNDRTGY